MPIVMPTRDDRVGTRTRITEVADVGDVGDADIPNLVQEALDEGAADRRLTRMVAALGLLLASLESPAQPAPTPNAYAETEASASRTR
jgi:hypothetical protein